MPKKRKDLTATPKNWRGVVEERIKATFPEERQREALRILRRREAEEALLYMIDAGGKERAIARFMKSLRSCAFFAARPDTPQYSFRDHRVAGRIVESIEIILNELDFLIDPESEDGDETPCRDSLIEIINYVKSASLRRPGAPVLQSKYMCLLHLERFFRTWFGRPVHGAIAAFAKATFPRDYDVTPTVNTIQIELGRARRLLLTQVPR